MNEYNEAIRNPTAESAQNVLNSTIPDEVNGLLPKIFERLDSGEDSRQIATDTVFDVLDITENQLNDGINTIFNSDLLQRITDLVLNITNSVIMRTSEILLT